MDSSVPLTHHDPRDLGSIYVKALANEDTLLRTHCCRHKCCPGHKKCFWFCSETFCVRNKCFPVCAAQETSWATMCRQQCVLVCQGLYETSNCMRVARFLCALQFLPLTVISANSQIEIFMDGPFTALQLMRKISCFFLWRFSRVFHLLFSLRGSRLPDRFQKSLFKQHSNSTIILMLTLHQLCRLMYIVSLPRPL